MRTPHQLAHTLLALGAFFILTSTAFAQADPGSPYPAASELSDQRAGSVLFYNLYSSNAANPKIENTLINITNTNTTASAIVHFFFVDSATSSVSTSIFCCLTPNQTAVLLASDVDPGTTGYVIGVAVSGIGCPVSFNFLIGDEYVKLASGQAANLGAETFAALYDGVLPGCSGTSTTAALIFNGVRYNRAPRVLALDKFRSPADGNSTLLILNRVGGSLVMGERAAAVGRISGEVTNSAGNSLSFTFTSGSTQFRAVLSDTFPAISPALPSFIPSGRTGWMKFAGDTDIGLLGAVINFNPNVKTSLSAFKQGHNLHKLTLSATNMIVMPVSPPNCG